MVQGTSYGPGNGGGHCSYQISGAVIKQPWITGINYYAASGQYAGSKVCGLCLRFRGTRAGGTIPLTTEYALSELFCLCIWPLIQASIAASR